MMARHSRVMIVVDHHRHNNNFFESEGYETSTYPSATDALTTISAGKFSADLIITDLNMPGVDGLDFCSQLQKSMPEVPVIVITANAGLETAIEALRRGALPFRVA